MKVYLDESGDLGFNFKRPFRKGGSSRYLTIAFLLVPKELSPLPKRIVKSLYRRKKRPPGNELKGGQLTVGKEVFFAGKVVKLLSKYPQIKVLAITVNKRKVKPHIRQDPNKLYNYMIGLVLLDKIKRQSRVSFIPDERSIKVASGNSLSEYLQVKLWFELNSKTVLENMPQESHKNLNLQFIDWIVHIIWQRHEDNNMKAFNVLKNKLSLRNLFFS